jgi:tetratricopeptide (TPR) repeat protein
MRIDRKILAAGVVMASSFAVGCNQSPQSKEAAFIKRGLTLAEQKDYGRALLEFRNAARAMPKDPEPRYRMGLAYLGEGRAGDALSSLKVAVALDPRHGPAQLKLAELLLSSRNHDLIEQATTELQSLLEASPDNPEIADRLAVGEWSLGKPAEAERLLQQSLDKFPTHLSSAVTLARIKLTRKDLKGAVAILQEAARNSPQSGAAAVALAQMYVMAGNPALAETELRRALQLNPKDSAALLSLSAAQISARKMTEAEETLRKLAELPDPELKALHPKFLLQTGHQEAALTEFEALAKASPDDRRARSRLVAAYVEMKRLPAAEALLAEALKKNPKDTDALLQRSQLYLQAGRMNDAGSDLKQVIHFNPGSAPAHFALAAVYKSQGLVRSEREELNEALKLNPDLLPARLWLVQSLLVGQENEAALSVLNQTPASEKQSLAVTIERNWALLFLGRDQEVRPVLDQALRYGSSPELVLQDAVLKMKAGNYAAARAAAEQILKQDPENSRAAHMVLDSYVAEKQSDKAGAWLTGMVAAHPRSAPLQFLLGEWLGSLHRNAEARKAFEAAIAINPALPGAGLALATLDLEENRFDAARKRLREMVDADNRNTKAMLMLASVEDSAGQPAAAIPYYRQVLGVDASNIFALNNLANHLTATNPEEALKLAQQAVEVAPDNPAVQDTLGWIYYRKGMYSMAVEHLKVAAMRQANPRRDFHLGMAYLKAGDPSRGQKMVTLALRSDPSLSKEQGW